MTSVHSLPATCSPAAREAPLSSPAPLAPQTRRQPKGQNVCALGAENGGETPAGCKRFESFVRRGIFPCNFFFLFKVCFKIKRERERERS